VLADAVAGTLLRVVERRVAQPLGSAGAWGDRLLMLELLMLARPGPRRSVVPATLEAVVG
jgi:hypothetical protein